MARIETRLVHEASPPDPQTGSVVPPLYATSTFRQERIGRHRGWEYGRTGNPTRAILEQAMARLEGGVAAYAFSSGMAAIDTLFHTLQSGDHIVVSEETYGGTRRILDHVYRKLGVSVTFVENGSPEVWEAAVTKRTKMFFVETPSNPLVRVTELKRISGLAKAAGALLCVDNTLASPYLQRPLELGADVVVHSATKYLGGHSDLLGGILVAKNPKIARTLGFLQNAIGGVCSPWDAWLLLRGLKTLHLRMEASCHNATELAKFLEGHPKVGRVHYPGLQSHPQARLARQQMRRPGGLLSFEYGTSLRQVKRILRSTNCVTLAESLGSVETLISHPWTMTHASIPAARRRHLGITPNLVRVSLGVENIEDILEGISLLLRGARIS